MAILETPGAFLTRHSTFTRRRKACDSSLASRQASSNNFFHLPTGTSSHDDLATIVRQVAIYPERLVFIDLSEHEQLVLEALATSSVETGDR